MALQVQVVEQDLQVPLAQLEKQELQELQVNQEQLDKLDRLALLDCKELQGQ